MFWPFNKYPGSDYETFNYDWVIGKLKELKDSVVAAKSSEEAAANSANAASGSMGMAMFYRNQAKDYRDEAQEQAEASAASAASIANVVDQVNTNTSSISGLIANAGDGTIPSELSDIRVAWNGKTYTTAGDAVRAQSEQAYKNMEPLGYGYVEFTVAANTTHSSNNDQMMINIPQGSWYKISVCVDSVSGDNPRFGIYEIDANATATAVATAIRNNQTDYYQASTDVVKLGFYANAFTTSYTARIVVRIVDKPLQMFEHDHFRISGVENEIGVATSPTWTRGIVKINGEPDPGNGATSEIISNVKGLMLEEGCRAAIVAYKGTTPVGRYKSDGTFGNDGSWGFVTGYTNIEAITSNIDSDGIKISIMPTDGVNVTATNVTMYGNTHALFYIKNETENIPLQENTIIKTLNHRGYNTEAPENTLPAYKLSRRKGFKYVETDVQFTSDNVAVLLHDDTINRTARNADGTEITSTVYINQITYAQALQYDFGIWKGQEFAGTPIPTLREFLLLCKKLSLNPWIELKSGGLTSAQAQIIANEIITTGMARNVSFLAFSAASLALIGSYFPDADFALAPTNGYTEPAFASMISSINNLKNAGHDTLASVSYGSMTGELYTQLRSAGVSTLIWTVDSPSALANIDDSVVAILSDNLRTGIIIEQNNL